MEAADLCFTSALDLGRMIRAREISPVEIATTVLERVERLNPILNAFLTPTPELAGIASELRPALRVVARPVRLETVAAGSSVGYGGEWTAGRASRIATLPIGYADGWSRASWPGGVALAGGRRVPIAGRVSMDSVCVDVSDVEGMGMDDEVVLLGAQGDERITANEVAALRRTIPNEVLSSLGARLPRVFVGSDQVAGAVR